MERFPATALAFPVELQRNAFGPRLVARPGDVWRGMQDVVVAGSSSVGWTPARYVEADRMFIVRTMAVAHHREVRIEEALVGRTWVGRARRDMLFTREVRLFSKQDQALVATATQEWALLTRAMVPVRAGPELYGAFDIIPGFPSVDLPEALDRAGSPVVHHFGFRTWHLWMDPHAHVNHPAYVDYCDEGTSRLVAQAGFDPQRLVPVTEQVHFRAALGPEEDVEVETTLKGELDAHTAVFSHRILAKGAVCATATTSRRLLEAPPRWFDQLQPRPR